MGTPQRILVPASSFGQNSQSSLQEKIPSNEPGEGTPVAFMESTWRDVSDGSAPPPSRDPSATQTESNIFHLKKSPMTRFTSF